eukprot:8046555-Pyramimonas_sp.AAC.1
MHGETRAAGHYSVGHFIPIVCFVQSLRVKSGHLCENFRKKGFAFVQGHVRPVAILGHLREEPIEGARVCDQPLLPLGLAGAVLACALALASPVGFGSRSA